VLTLMSLLALLLPDAARSQSPTPTPSPPATGATPSPATPAPTASPTGSPAPVAPAPAAKPGRSTDTEYLKVQIDEHGRPVAAWLKDWIRLRGAGRRTVSDPATFAGVTFLQGTPRGRESGKALSWDVRVGGDGFKDLYYEGRLQQAGDYFVTPDGLKPLPINVRVRYFLGEEGAETEAKPEELEGTDRAARFKIVITVTNMTRSMEEVTYSDIQTKKAVTAVAPVWTPYVARVVDLRFPDGSFDQIQADGDVTRDRAATVVNWTKNLVPPDFPAQQDAVVTGVIAKGSRLPEIKVVAQPVFPPFEAEALNASGIQFERGRRNFFYDVFGLFRENLISLTGLFGLLHDAFGNLTIPLLGPDKGNREFGSFDKPNQLWALWTLTKGIEQLDRAFNLLDHTSEILRDAVKGSLATLNQLRLFVGFSTDENIVAGFPPASANDALLGSIWSDLKNLATICGDADWALDTRPYFPETPLIACPAIPALAPQLNLIFLKLALVEHDLHSVQKENHDLDTGLLAGLANLPDADPINGPICGADQLKDNNAGQTCGSYSKYLFIKFPFGLEEIERGLYVLKAQGLDLLQAAIGNKDQPNSLVFALHTLTEGAEAQIDAFHQLGATWRFIADSIQNFAIFGVETSRNLLQWDINAIDLDTAVKAAEVERVREMATFMGRPKDVDGEPAIGQLVITFSTSGLAEHPRATDTTKGRAAVLVAVALLLSVLGGFARFRWFII
jgi:hypothetical protein